MYPCSHACMHACAHVRMHAVHIHGIHSLAEGSLKSNFRQYRQMEKGSGAEKKSEEKESVSKKEDQGARKGRKVAKPCETMRNPLFFPMLWLRRVEK
jgi:hypothetical protein